MRILLSIIIIALFSCSEPLIFPNDLTENETVVSPIILPVDTCLLIWDVYVDEVGYNIITFESELCFESTDNASVWDISFAEYCDTKLNVGNLTFTYSLEGDCGVTDTYIQIEKLSSEVWLFEMQEFTGEQPRNVIFKATIKP